MTNSIIALFNSLLPANAQETPLVESDRFYNYHLYPVWGVPSYFNVNVASGGLINGMYDAWCLDPVGSISRGTIYPVTVYSSYSAYGSIDGVLPSGQVDLDLDGYYDSLQAVNWIFNNIVEPGNVVLEPSPSSAFTNSYSYNIDGVAGNETFTSGDVQWAIWKVLGAPPAEISAGLGSLIDYDHSGVMAQNIANLAIAEGVAFVPVAGQDIGIILSPGGNNPSHQPTIIEVKTAGIGDTVFADCNLNNAYDIGEGINGVTVKLLADTDGDGDFEVVATTVTGDNPNTANVVETGYYFFGPLLAGPTYDSTGGPGSGITYQVMVDTSTLPQNGAGWTNVVDPDGGNDSMSTETLTPGEVNLAQDFGYRSPNYAPVCITYDFSGNSSTDGLDGNSRVYTDAGSGVSVTATAWSRQDSNGNWAEAYLGAYGGGNGVTDTSEGSGSGNRHTVDNVGGRDNYVVYQFSQSVIVDRAYLGYVVDDSDISVWIGSSAIPINNVNDALLASMTSYESNNASNGSSRWADFNSGDVSGNVLIIAASVEDKTPDDEFKIEKLKVCTAVNCEPEQPKASIGDRVWLDSNGDGLQGSDEAGVAGVTVKLLNKTGGEIGSTTTDSNGYYLFSNLTPDDYAIKVVKPVGYTFTTKDAGNNDAKDSDVDTGSGQTVSTQLTAGENDLSWDAGLFKKASVGDKVWDDMNHNNIQDSSEPGIGGIKVKLLDAVTGATVASTTTNSSGNYLFSNINPGTYVLEFDKGNVQYYQYKQWNNMSNWKWAVQDTGSNDAVDSDVAGDATAKTNVSKTMAFSLVSGQNDMTRDAGITPIVIDLDGNGIQTVSRANSTGTFDLFGNGNAVQSGWISGGEGFLAVDKNGNGQIDDISELFGGMAKGAGFAQLASYDSNGDGLVDAADSDFVNLLIWRDVNGNHQSDVGELMTLAETGVAALNVDFSELPFLDREGNLHFERSSATMADGRTVDMTDVYFNVAADDAAAAGVVLPGLADLWHEGWSVGGDSDIYFDAAANDGAAAAEVPVSDPGWMFA